MNPPDDYLKLSDPVRQTLEVLSQQEGWRFLSTNSLSPEILNEDIRVFVFFDGTDEILEMVNSRLGTIFVGIGVEGLVPKENLIIIGPDGFRLDQQAFLAGFIAAVLTQDWRIGEIVQLPTEDLPAVELGFQNGITFYCGLCLLAYPPFHNYPIFYSIEGGSSDGNWSPTVESLQSFAVNTIFLFTNELDLAALEQLEMAGILLLGTSAPPEEFLSNWIATVRLTPEVIILENWDAISSGQGGWIELIPISIEDVNQSLLSEGKLRFIREVLIDIQEGYISPAVTPPALIDN